MKAILIERFGEAPRLTTVADPIAPKDGVVVQVMATSVCRSDWHAWMGHDADVELPHVPGHELAGIVAAVGSEVGNWRVGDRVTVPFVSGCGACEQCHAGQQQVCDHQFQPGFTHWGSFAEYVALHHADLNVVALPESVDFATAASLGCRFATAFRAVVDQGRTQAGQWLVVHGCGGVDLSAVMIANALGANVVAVDITLGKLQLARELGAAVLIDSTSVKDVPQVIKGATGGGAHVSLDALGHPQTSNNSILSLRKRGKHIQVGLMLGEHSTPEVPMQRIIADELEILGSHGMQAHRYGQMLAMIGASKLQPELLLGQEINLKQAIAALTSMDQFQGLGTTVITEF